LAARASGSFLNVASVEATNHYQHIAVEKTRLHIPILFGLDVIHGTGPPSCASGAGGKLGTVGG